MQCYSAAAVAGGNVVGGLAGDNVGGDMSQSYSTGAISGNGNVAGLVGRNDAPSRRMKRGIISDCFWDIQTSGQTTSSGGTGKTTAEMRTTRTFLRWGTCGDGGAWTIDEGNDYPRLAWERRPGDGLDFHLSDFLEGSGTEDDRYLIYTAYDNETIASFPCEQDKHFRLAFLAGRGTEDNPYLIHTGDEINLLNMCPYYVQDAHFKLAFLAGEGTQQNPYRISTAEQLNLVGLCTCERDAEYKLASDIDLAGFDGREGRPAFTMISVFIGVFDGDGHTISHLTIEGGSGLFGFLTSKAEVRNLGVVDVNIASAGEYIGGLVGSGSVGVDTKSFWDIQTSGQTTSAGGTGLTTAEMQTASTFLDAGWDFVGEAANGTEDVWKIAEFLGYPRLWWEAQN